MEGNNQLCIQRWTTRHVAKWLKEEGFCEYVDILCDKHRLDGITLLTLTEYDLRSPPLEIKVLGDIKRLMLSIRKLQKHHLDALEELGYGSDSPIGPLSPVIGSLQGTDWFCNGEVQRDCDDCEPVADLNAEQYQYANGKNKHSVRRLNPEYWKTALSCIYVFIVFGFTSFVMVIVHERVPDMQTYPPLPDIFLDSVPRIPWAFAMTEEFTTSGSSNTDTGKVNGSLQTKYKWAEYGVTFTEKWNTDNTLGTEMAIEDQLAKGLKLTFDTTFSPNTGKKSGKIKSAYKRECINLGCDVDFDFAGPAIHGSAVLGYEGWLAGYQMTFDSAKSKNDGSEFGGSIYQKVSDNLESAINLTWMAGTNSTSFGIAAKYQLDPTASISV
ncbi:Sphingomyelin synthase-related protein 1 [Varanus komodoensis]|nr:Sphingomyelin synthase-related protein 1 [Varanus komodoensis]